MYVVTQARKVNLLLAMWSTQARKDNLHNYLAIQG